MNNLFDQYKYQPQNVSVLTLIKDYEKEYYTLFSNIKNQWNNRIREFLRDSTGLKLNQRQTQKYYIKDISIEIVIKPDEDDYFIRLIDKNFPYLDFYEYERIRELFTYLEKAKPFLIRHENSHFYELFNFCKEYLEFHDLNKILKILFEEEWKAKDILGSYFYDSHKIELYYLPLIIFSKLTGKSLENMFIVVLTHELAHAYHHMGRDNDGNMWVEMRGADISIKEGLAQYYSCLFAEEQKSIFPGIFKAYQDLLAHQEGPYVVHKDWFKYKKEAIKAAMIMLRVNERIELKKFIENIKDFDEKLTHKK